MTHAQDRTITENLDEYRKLKQDGYSQGEIAEKMDFSNARISQFAAYWVAVNHRWLDPQLIRVIRVHNNIHVRRGKETRLFRLDKLDKKGADRLVFGQCSVRFPPRQQAVALQETFESAKEHDNIRPTIQYNPFKECTDEELAHLQL